MSRSLEEALRPFLAFIATNDGDTLARLSSNETVVAKAEGAWSGAVVLTLGDFRRLREAVAGT